MPHYNKKYYQQKLVQARKDYVCDLSGLSINKGEHYVRITIDVGRPRVGRHSRMYIEREVKHVSKKVLAYNSMESILDATGLFESDNDKINRLEKENIILKNLVSILLGGMVWKN
jgi:hypothetical protein